MSNFLCRVGKILEFFLKNIDKGGVAEPGRWMSDFPPPLFEQKLAQTKKI